MHWLLGCPALRSSREDGMKNVTATIEKGRVPFELEGLTDSELVQVGLDPSRVVTDTETVCDLERASSKLVFSLHCRHMYLLDQKKTSHTKQLKV